MRIEYEIDAEDFADVSIAAAIPKRNDAAARGRRLPPWIVWTLAGLLVAISATAAVWPYVLPARGSTPPPFLEAIFDAIASAEWLLPWYVWVFAILVVTASSRRGRRAYRIASLINVLLFSAGAGLVYLAGQRHHDVSRLAGSGVLRIIPWTFVYGIVFASFSAAWFQKRWRLAFALSWYVDQPRTLTLDEDFVYDGSDLVTARYRWAAFARIGTSARLLMLYNRAGQVAVFVPLRAIGDTEAVRTLLETVASRVGGTRAFSVIAVPPAKEG